MAIAHARYSKNEIHNRVFWVNNFRIFFGLVFFVGLVLLNAFSVSLSPNIVALVMLGIAVLVYSLLSFFYLATQKPALNEIIFVSIFLSIIDVIIITIFIYFSGGYESPYYVFYLLALTTVVIGIPYFTFSVFLLAGVAAIFYDMLIFFTISQRVPFYSEFHGLLIMQPNDVYLSLLSAVITPAVIFFFAAGAYLIARFLQQVRLEMDEKVEEEKSVEKAISSFSQVYLLLTHLFKLDEMLNNVLQKILEILKINAGIILIVDKDHRLICRARQGVPQGVIDNFENKTFKEAGELPPNLKGIVWGEEGVHNWSIRKLVFHNKPQGLLVLFGTGGSDWIDPRFKETLDGDACELAAAIYYAKLLRTVKLDQ